MWILIDASARERTKTHTCQIEADRAGATCIYFVRLKFCFLWRGGRNFDPRLVLRQITGSICRIGPVVGIDLPVGPTLIASPTYEPQHYKTNKMTCAPREDSDQPGHPPSQCVAEEPMFLHADSKDSDQTGRMSRLIWVFAARRCHFVGLVVWWFI